MDGRQRLELSPLCWVVTEDDGHIHVQVKGVTMPNYGLSEADVLQMVFSFQAIGLIIFGWRCIRINGKGDGDERD